MVSRSPEHGSDQELDLLSAYDTPVVQLTQFFRRKLIHEDVPQHRLMGTERLHDRAHRADIAVLDLDVVPQSQFPTVEDLPDLVERRPAPLTPGTRTRALER
ncbi:hypothetical protein AB0I91_07605 [Actinosynnema sp. NPDC049800]